MAGVKLSRNWDFFFQRRLKLLPKLADKAVKKTAIQGKKKVRGSTPVDTGFLKRSWKTSRQVLGVWILENFAPYASFVEEGTGLFGPRKKKIVPKTKPFLVFRTKSGAFVRTKSVKGQKAQRMLARNRSFIRKKLKENLRKFLRDLFKRKV